MAQFYAEIQGGRGIGSRVGSKVSGIRGWGTGVKVMGHVTVSGEDEFTIYATGGSRGARGDVMIGTVLADGRFIAADTALKAAA